MIDLETNDIAYLSSKSKRDAARAAILQARQALERAAEEVDNYLEKFRDAETDTEKATITSGTSWENLVECLAEVLIKPA